MTDKPQLDQEDDEPPIGIEINPKPQYILIQGYTLRERLLYFLSVFTVGAAFAILLPK